MTTEKEGTEKEIARYDSLKKIIDQFKFCNYATRDGNHQIENNVAFIALERMADSKLIAAAPDLLSALEILLSAYRESIKLTPSRDCYLDAQLAIADKAIAKATITQPVFEMEKEWPASSTVAKTSYRPMEQQLFVEFKNGKRYQYSLVPLQLWDEMVKCESIGSFLHKKVKGDYEGILLD